MDTLTGKVWRADISSDGAIRGQDLDGARWSFGSSTHTYTNTSSGPTCAKTTILHVCPV